MLLLTMDTTEETNNKERFDAFVEIYREALVTASIPSLLVEMNLGEMRGYKFNKLILKSITIDFTPMISFYHPTYGFHLICWLPLGK